MDRASTPKPLAHPLRTNNTSAVPTIFHHTEIKFLRNRLQDPDALVLFLSQEVAIDQAIVEEVAAQTRERGASNASLCLLVHLCKLRDVSLREKFDEILENTQPEVFEGLQELIRKATIEADRKRLATDSTAENRSARSDSSVSAASAKSSGKADGADTGEPWCDCFVVGEVEKQSSSYESRSHALLYLQAHTGTRTRAHTRTHKRAHTHTRTHAHTHTHAYAKAYPVAGRFTSLSQAVDSDQHLRSLGYVGCAPWNFVLSLSVLVRSLCACS